MRIHTCVASRAGELLALLKGDVLTCLWIAVTFGEPVIDQVDYVGLRASAHAKVLRLDVTVKELFRMVIL